MLVLVLADTRLTSSLGPVAAIGVACAMVAGLTLLPGAADDLRADGLLAAPRDGRVRPRAPCTARQGVWRRFGDKVLERPLPALIVTVVVFAAGALGLLAYKVDYSTTNFFKKSVDSVEGFEVLRQSFPAGTLAPTTVLVERTRRAGDRRGRRPGGAEARRRERRGAGDADRAAVEGRSRPPPST